MEKNNMVPAAEFCTYHSISYTFISGLQDAGLIEIITVEEQAYLYTDQLPELEKLVRFHTELEINMEGVEAIAHLLRQVEALQRQINTLSQRLLLYEQPGNI